MKKKKIICTIGPACENRETLKNMMLAGMNAARFNFSHGTHEEHKRRIDLVKELRSELGLHIALILDTKGPEIRTGVFSGGEVQLIEGQQFIFFPIPRRFACGTNISLKFYSNLFFVIKSS